MAELLVSQGASVQARDNHGLTPLHAAAQSEIKGEDSSIKPEVTEYLLNLHADVNAKDNEEYE